MAEQPPLSRIHVVGYSANDRDFPILNLVLDPRVAGYRVPEDLSACPDKRYPNHVFTGAQPISGDQRVRHVWEILPSPWVPFTRYDDDLGPVQGRRRSVKNEGQVAVREADKQVTYEAREGSAIVYTELEETWSIKTDEDGNSLFPIRDRDFYDPSRGPVQERRQLLVPTGEEEGSLENVNGVITQTSYEPYNDFLSVKIVQTYKVDGPQLIGKATDNDGQLVTVTTQRKGADGYIPPNPTATRTVEVSREDAEAVIERIVDTPEVFKANTFSLERPDPIPQKFRVAVPLESSQEIVEGTAEVPSLSEGEISRTEEQRNKFIKRVTATSRDQTVLPKTLIGKATDNDRQTVTITETLQLGDTDEVPTATKTVESEALGDGNYVITKTEVPEVFSGITFSVERPDFIPQKFRVAVPSVTKQESLAGQASQPVLASGDIAKSEQQVNRFVKRISETTRSDTKLPQKLTQKATNQEKQLVTITETLQSGDTNEQPTSRIDIQSEALGDGKYIVTKTQAPEVFKAQTYRAEKADLTPQKFRAKQTDLVTEENVEGDAQPITTLGENEFLKSEQQVNKFVKRVTTNTRNTEINETLSEFVLTPEGQLATRTITLAKANQTLVPSAALIDGDVEELGDGRTIKTEIRVDEPFDAKQESLEKPEVIPPEFRASLQNKTTSEIKAGQSVKIPSLAQEELSKTIQRITEHKIRETRTIRPATNYPPLSGEIVDNDLIKVSRVRTVAQGTQTITPSATVSGTVEALGDGYTLKTEDTKAKVFAAKTFAQERPDNIPVEFRVEKPATTQEFNEEGTAAEVALVDTEIAKSEQQVNEFVKRVRKTTRDDVGDVVLNEEQVDQDGIKVSVTRSLVKGEQSIEPSAIVRGQVQNLGGGYTVKTELTREKVFPQLALSKERPDPAPEKFRVEIPALTTELTEESSEVTEADVNLEQNDLSKSVQQVDAFLKRTRTTSREEAPSATLTGKQTGTWGSESVVETYDEDSNIISGYTILSSKKIPLGGNKFLGEKVQVDNPQTLIETRIDPDTKIGLRIEKSLVPASTQLTSLGENQAGEVTPIDAWNSIQIITTATSVPQDETFDTTINYSYPDELVEVGIDWENGKDVGSDFDKVINRQYYIDNNIGWNFGIAGVASSTLRGAAYVNIKRGYSGPVRARVTRKYYLTPPQSTPNITDWGSVYGTITIRGIGRLFKDSSSASGVGSTRLKESSSRQIRVDTFANTVIFGPIVHDGVGLINELLPNTLVQTDFQPNTNLPDGSPLQQLSQTVGATGLATLHLPPSGTVPTSGTESIGLVRVEKWRLGVWIEETYRIFHP